MVGIAGDQRTQLPALEELVLIRLQVQDDGSPTLGQFNGLQRILALAVALPLHALARRCIGAAAEHGDLVGHHERGIEAHAELTNQPRIGLLRTRHRFQETSRAGAGDGADVRDHLIAIHADAVVAHGNRARIRIPAHVDMQLAIASQQLGFGNRLEAQLVAGVGGVGNQLAQEDFLVRIQRMSDQVQYLGNFGFEFPGFSRCVHTVLTLT